MLKFEDLIRGDLVNTRKRLTMRSPVCTNLIVQFMEFNETDNYAVVHQPKSEAKTLWQHSNLLYKYNMNFALRIGIDYVQISNSNPSH